MGRSLPVAAADPQTGAALALQMANPSAPEKGDAETIEEFPA
jgi:hypothetical protein